MILSRLNLWNTSRPRLPSPEHRQCPPSLQGVDERQILGAKPVIEHKQKRQTIQYEHMLRKTSDNQRMTQGERFSIIVYHSKYMITE